MFDILKGTVEYQNWGANAATFSFLATVIFTALQGWSLFEQNATIRRLKSGESLSITFFIYGGNYFLMFFLYGILRDSIAMTLNGLLFIPYVFILLALLRFRGFSGGNWMAFSCFILMMPVLTFLPNANGMRDTFVLIGLFGLLVPLVGQIREMYKTKRPGAVEPKFIFTFMVSNVFWFTYGLTNEKWIFVVFNPIAFVMLYIVLMLYRRYKSRAALA